jgi:hypothetical protein
VLFTGDRELPDPVFRRFNGMVVDAKHLVVSEQIFSLFAATEADIWIGDNGGGTWLPGINSTPRLVINAFPYYYGYPSSWMFYKTVRDKFGRLMDLRGIFQEHPYDYEISAGVVYDNTSDEIIQAVAQFLEDLEQPEDFGRTFGLDGVVPEETWFTQAGAKLSSAWLRLYSFHVAPKA